MKAALFAVGCMPLLGAGFISPLFLPTATFQPLDDGRLRPFKLLLTLHVAWLEINGELQMIATQTPVCANPPPAAQHPILKGSPAGMKLQVIFGSLWDCPFNQVHAPA